jgi:hypothetical protein
VGEVGGSMTDASRSQAMILPWLLPLTIMCRTLKQLREYLVMVQVVTIGLNDDIKRQIKKGL